MAIYQDRAQAGRQLAQLLLPYKSRENVLVLALPRGGVPVAFEVAQALDAPLDIFLVRKLGVPGREELAMGAIASGGVRVINADVVEALHISDEVIERAAEDEQRELERREQVYRGNRPHPIVQGRVIILIDDGLATGSSMRAAVAGLGVLRPEWIVVAVPVAPAETCELLRREVDEVVCAATPDPFVGVGAWYANFIQTTDEEVRSLLRRAQPVR